MRVATITEILNSIDTDAVTAERAAEILDRSVATVYRAARAGRLRRVRVLGRVLFVRDEVERLAHELNARIGAAR